VDVDVRGDHEVSWTIGPKVVLVVARMISDERYKGHDQLLDAWPAVLAAIPEAQLVFAGTGDDVPQLRARATHLGIAGSVVFTGFVSEPVLASLYRKATLLAMPSRDEGFGLVYLEAMAHRLPCIGSIHDAAGDVIEEGVTGFLVDQSDVVALADRIVRLLGNDARRAEMGARGHARLVQQFGYERFRDRLLSLLLPSFGELEPAPLAAAVAG
jgi:phosphatidylinositol alpha-1,6-mannosyltransferase